MSLDNLILSVVERWWAGRYSERHAIVSSWDSKNHLAKVTLQPEGQETGWLPVETSHIGQNYGILIGLQPGQAGVDAKGQGGQSGPEQNNQGDQVIVRWQEGDVESGKVAGRVHSDQDKPPEVKSGEMLLYTKFQKSGGPTPDAGQGGQGGTGSQIHFKNDGSLTFTDGNGGSLVFDGQGNCTLNCKKMTFKVENDRELTIGGSDTVKISGSLNKTVSGTRTDKVSGSWTTNAANSVWSWLTSKGDEDDA